MAETSSTNKYFGNLALEALVKAIKDQFDATNVSVKTVTDKVNNATTGLDTKASAADLTSLTNKVNNATTGLDKRALQSDLEALQKTALKQIAVSSVDASAKTITLGLTWNATGGTGLTTPVTINLADMFNAYQTTDRFLTGVAPNTDGTKIVFTFNVKSGEMNTNESIEVALSDILKGLKGSTGTDITVSVTANTISATLTETGIKKTVGDLATTVGSTSSGLVKDVNDLKTTVGSSSSGLVQKVNSIETVVGASDAAGLRKKVADLETSVGTNDTTAGTLRKRVKDIEGAGYITNAALTGYAKTDSVVLKVDYMTATEVETIWKSVFGS